MKKVYFAADTIVSPLGFSTQENLAQIRAYKTGIHKIDDVGLHKTPFYGALIAENILDDHWQSISKLSSYTKLEKMMILSLSNLIKKNPKINVKKCGIIISTTKGNIDGLQNENSQTAYLSNVADTIQDFFELKETPIVLSNACISGGLALAIAKRMIQANKYEDMIVIGGDLLSEFTLSGFFSFQAVSDAPCKPFCKHRTGISLGEAAACAWLTSKKENINDDNLIQITGDASANDANHISGPSRTGEGLFISIKKAMKEARISSTQIDYITAHGTATVFNDEMEAIAFNRSGLQHVPVNSFKGYYGHTLGASALIESIIARHCLLNNEIFASLGFEELGVSEPLNVIQKNESKIINRVLKTASGFGGCNVALIIEKVGR